MDEDGLERMCKKVSQLTRVIYLINTKNDDNQALVESLISSYDIEVENIRKQAKEVISSLKSKIYKMQDTRGPEDKVKEIKRNYENSLLVFSETVKQFKEEVEKKETKISKEYQEKYDKMVKQVNDLKRNTEKTIAEREKKELEEKDKLTKKHIAEIEKMNREFDIKNKMFEDKIAMLSNEAKDQIEKLTNEHNRYVEIIKEEFEKKLKEKDRLISQTSSSQNQLVENTKKKFEEQIKALIDECSLLKAKISDYEKEMSSITKILNGYEIDIQSLKKIKVDLEEKLSKNANISLEEKNKIQKEIEDLKNQLKNEKNKNEEKTIKIHQIQDLLLSKDTLISQLTNENMTQKKEGNSEMNTKNEMIQEMKNKVNKLNNTLYEKLNEIDAMRLTIENLTKDIKDLNEQIKALNNDINQSNQNTEMRVLELRKQLLNNDNEYKKKNDALVSYYESKLGEIASDAKKKEDQLNYDHSLNINSLRDTFEKEKNTLESMLNNERKTLSNKIKELTDALNNSNQNSTSTITVLEQRIKSLEELLLTSSHDVSQLKNQLTNQAQNNEKVITALKESFHNQIKLLQDKLEKAQQSGIDTSKDLNKAIAKLTSEHQKEMDFLESNHREELDRLKYQSSLSANESKLKYDKEISELKIKVAGMEADFLKNNKNTNDSLNKLIKEQQKEIYELKQRSQLDLNQMKNNFEEKLSNMQNSFNDKQTQLKGGYEEKIRQLNKEQNELKAKHSAEIAKVFNDNKIIIDDYEKQFKHDTMVLNKTITDLNSQVASLDIHINDLTKKTSGQDDTIVRLTEENSQLKKEIESFNVKITKAEKESKDAQEMYEKLKEQIVKEYDEKNRLIEKSLAERTKVFKDFHVGEFGKIKTEFLETLQLLEKKNSSLTFELDDLKAFIAKRPSRDEDVDEINNLRDELERKEKEYEETTALLEQFRNELLNREENYNGYFDRKPKVGYVNPLKDKGDKKNKAKPNNKIKGLNMSGNSQNNFPKLVSK